MLPVTTVGPFETIWLEPAMVVVLDEEELSLDPDTIIMPDFEDEDAPDTM